MSLFRKTLGLFLLGLISLDFAAAAITALAADAGDAARRGAASQSGQADAAVRAPSEASLAIESVQIGFGGVYKAGHWAPVRVTLSNSGPRVDVRLQLAAQDSDGVEAILVRADESPLSLNAGARTVVLQYVKAGRVGSGLVVRLVGPQGVLAARTFSAGELGPAEPSTRELIVSLAPAIGLEDAARKARRDRSQGVAVAAVTDSRTLPADWFGYEAADIVVATTGQAGVLEQLTEPQFEALDRWLQLGGRLVLCAGRRGAEVLAPGSRLERFSPARPGSDAGVEVQTLRVTSGLESYAGSNERLDSVGGQRARRFGIPITALSHVRGLIESSETGGPTGRLPTIVRFPYGLGQITFLAFDPELPPFDGWQGRPTLMARVLQIAGPGWQSRAESETRQGQGVHLGYEDLVGQLRSALEQYPGVTRIQFSWVAGLLALYIALIGPADYFLLKRFRRQTWTWLSFSLVAVAFCLLAYGLMQRVADRQVHVNQVDLVDVDLASGLVRGSAWTHIYSPVTDRYTLNWLANVPVTMRDTHHFGRLLSWQGLPGGGLGGLDRRTVGTILFAEPYLTGCRDERGPPRMEAGPSDSEPTADIADLPIEVSGTKSLFGAWWVVGELAGGQRLTASAHGSLTGQLTNPLDCELTDCMVLYENWMYPVTGTLGPGEAVAFDGVSPRHLEWHLSRRRVVDSKDVGTPWDQASADVPRILEMMMFYRAAGGAAYTGLSHRYQPSLDLSEHLRTGCAILVGRSATPGSRLRAPAADWPADRVRQWAFYRVVFPVDRSERTAVP